MLSPQEKVLILIHHSTGQDNCRQTGQDNCRLIHIGEVDNKTPAMRLGLAKGPVSYEKIIYFDWNMEIRTA